MRLLLYNVKLGFILAPFFFRTKTEAQIELMIEPNLVGKVSYSNDTFSFVITGRLSCTSQRCRSKIQSIEFKISATNTSSHEVIYFSFDSDLRLGDSFAVTCRLELPSAEYSVKLKSCLIDKKYVLWESGPDVAFGLIPR